MSKRTVLLNAISLAFCAAAADAEAKLIRYEINGQRYSYSTNNHQQTREARERIAAAAAAEAAKARAEAEAAANPLVRIFGSPVQREAAEAQARVQKMLTGGGAQPDVVSTSSVGNVGTEHRGPSRRAVARRERRQAVRQARRERQRQVDRTDGLSTRRAKPEPVGRDTATGPAVPLPQLKPITPTPVMGSAQFAPARSSDSPRVPAPADAGGSLTDFVNQVRKAP